MLVRSFYNPKFPLLLPRSIDLRPMSWSLYTQLFSPLAAIILFCQAFGLLYTVNIFLEAPDPRSHAEIERTYQRSYMDRNTSPWLYDIITQSVIILSLALLVAD